MTEGHRPTAQFIGQADARKFGVENKKPQEFQVSPEQQQVVDVMKNSAEVMEDKILEARDQAGKQLKELHGQALVNAGVKQMGRGIWETFKKQVTYGLGLGIVGGFVGNFGGSDVRRIGRNILDVEDPRIRTMTRSNAVVGSAAGITIGRYLGYEVAGLSYNKNVANQKNLPQVKWYDWAVSNAGLVGVTMLRNRHLDSNALTVMHGLGTTIFNPITIGGLRNTMIGLWEMRKGASNGAA